MTTFSAMPTLSSNAPPDALGLTGMHPGGGQMVMDTFDQDMNFDDSVL